VDIKEEIFFYILLYIYILLCSFVFLFYLLYFWFFRKINNFILVDWNWFTMSRSGIGTGTTSNSCDPNVNASSLARPSWPISKKAIGVKKLKLFMFCVLY